MRYVLPDPIDAAKIVNCHGHGEHHWLLVLDDARTQIVTHDWVHKHQPITVGDYLIFDKNGPESVPGAIFERLFSRMLRKIA